MSMKWFKLLYLIGCDMPREATLQDIHKVQQAWWENGIRQDPFHWRFWNDNQSK